MYHVILVPSCTVAQIFVELWGNVVDKKLRDAQLGNVRQHQQYTIGFCKQALSSAHTNTLHGPARF